MISAYTGDNASVNYGKYNSVFQKLNEDNSGIIKANCIAHIGHNCAKHAGDRLNIDIPVHVPTRWLSLWPAVKRLHDTCPAIKSYFLSLGENQCPKALWQLIKKDQHGDGQPLELQVYLAFLNNVLKIFHDVVLQLEGQNGTVCELYDIMFTLKTKLQQ